MSLETLDSIMIDTLNYYNLPNHWEYNFNSLILQYTDGFYFAKCVEHCNYCFKSKIANHCRSYAKCNDVTFHLIDNIFTEMGGSIKLKMVGRSPSSSLKIGVINEQEWNSFQLYSEKYQHYWGKILFVDKGDYINIKIIPSTNKIVYTVKDKNRSNKTVTEKYTFSKGCKFKVYVEFTYLGTILEIV